MTRSSGINLESYENYKTYQIILYRTNAHVENFLLEKLYDEKYKNSRKTQGHI